MKKLTLSLTLAGVTLCGSLYAQEAATAERGYTFLDQVFETRGRADVDRNLGTNPTGVGGYEPNDVHLWRSSTELGLNVPVGDGHEIRFSGGFIYDSYDWGGVPDNEEPFSGAQEVPFTVRYRYLPEGVTWGYEAFGSLRFGKTNGGDFLEGAHGYAGVGAMYQMSETLAVGFGGFFNSNLEDDDVILPYVAIHWQPTEQLTLRTFNGIMAEYQLDQDGQHTIDGEILYNWYNYQMGDSNGLNVPDAVIEKQEWVASVGYTWQATKFVAVRPFISGVFNSEINYRIDGAEFADTEVDDTWQAGVHIKIRY